MALTKYPLIVQPLWLIFTGMWWTSPSHVVNQNSWSVSLDQGVLLDSQQDNLGDMILLDRAVLNRHQQLRVAHFIYGGNGLHATTHLILKDESGKVLRTYTNRKNGIVLKVDMPAMDLCQLVQPDQAVGMFFVIEDPTHQTRHSIKMGVIQLV